MMNSDPYPALLEQILLELAPSKLTGDLHDYATTTLASQKKQMPKNPSYWNFIDLITALVTCLQKSSPEFPSHLSPEEAFTFGIQWLDQNFPSNRTSGSEAALLEFIQTKHNIFENIGQALTTGYITQEQNKARQRVIVQRIGDDWEHRRRLAQTFLTKFRENLPLEITRRGSRHWADSIESLLSAFARTQANLHELFSNR